MPLSDQRATLEESPDQRRRLPTFADACCCIPSWCAPSVPRRRSIAAKVAPPDPWPPGAGNPPLRCSVCTATRGSPCAAVPGCRLRCRHHCRQLPQRQGEPSTQRLLQRCGVAGATSARGLMTHHCCAELWGHLGVEVYRRHGQVSDVAFSGAVALRRGQMAAPGGMSWRHCALSRRASSPYTEATRQTLRHLGEPNKSGIRRPATWLLGGQVDQLGWTERSNAIVPPVVHTRQQRRGRHGGRACWCTARSGRTVIVGGGERGAGGLSDAESSAVAARRAAHCCGAGRLWWSGFHSGLPQSDASREHARSSRHRTRGVGSERTAGDASIG